MIDDWIKRYLETEREDRDPKHVGLSSSGKCGRQLAYKYHGTQGIPLGWRPKAIFSDGNNIQDQLRQWIHLSDRPECYYLADEETEVEIKTPKGKVIKGHVDGIIWHKPELHPNGCTDPSHSTRLLEIKSMSSNGFRALKREGLERSYIVQVCAYLRACNLQEALVLVKNKDTSDLKELVITRDDKLVDENLAKLDQVLDSTTPDSVQRMYAPNEDGALPWNCGYCPYWATCWAEAGPVENEAHKITLTGDYREL